MGQGNSSQRFRPLDLEKLFLWFAEFEQACEANGITEVAQYTYLLKEIPREYEKDVLAVASKSFREGHYQRLKDALIEAVHPNTGNNLNNANTLNTISALGKSDVQAKNFNLIASDKLGSSSDRRTVQNHISTEGTSKVKAMENFNCYASAEAVAAIAKAASTSKAIEASDVKVEPDSFYELGNSSGDPKRGKLIIFNFKEYPNADDERTGTEMDAEALKETFEMLNFNIEPLENTLNRTSEQLHAYLNYVSTSIGKHYHCLVIAILAHGEKGQFFCSDGKSFTYDDLYAYFTECPTLAGKPKIFLIQACRGRKFDEGVKTDEMQLRLNPNADPNVIPNTADFLKVYSCCPDYRAIRSELNGSWFIQALCRIINENWQRKTLVDMVMMTQTDVAGQEAIVGYSIARKWALEHSVKQMVVYESTLRKKIKF